MHNTVSNPAEASFTFADLTVTNKHMTARSLKGVSTVERCVLERITLDALQSYQHHPKLAISDSKLKKSTLQTEGDLILFNCDTAYSRLAATDMLHIKPWRDCEGAGERLDPYNGIMLAAHVDALFDKGYLTFSNEGELIPSAELDVTTIFHLILQK